MLDGASRPKSLRKSNPYEPMNPRRQFIDTTAATIVSCASTRAVES